MIYYLIFSKEVYTLLLSSVTEAPEDFFSLEELRPFMEFFAILTLS